LTPLKDLSPEQRLKHQAIFAHRPQGWCIMDKLGMSYLHPDGSCSDQPAWYPSKPVALAHYRAWSGIQKRSAGRKNETGQKPRNKAQTRFERALGVLMNLWQAYPRSVTIESTKRAVEKRLGREFATVLFRRDLMALVRFGYAVKQGPTYTAVKEFRRWWSDEFGDGLTPKSGGQDA
jgi:hypothetical protein